MTATRRYVRFLGRKNRVVGHLDISRGSIIVRTARWIGNSGTAASCKAIDLQVHAAATS